MAKINMKLIHTIMVCLAMAKLSVLKCQMFLLEHPARF